MTGQRKKRIAGSYFVSTLSISLVLVVVGILVFILLNAKLVSDHVKQNIGFSIIVKDNVNEAEIKKMQKILDTKPFVSSSVFISKVEAAREFKEELGEDFIGKAELAEDGTVKGLDDEVKKLVEGKDTAFLFEKSTGTKFKGAKSAEKGDGAEGGMTLEKLKAMNPLDRYNYSVNHPDEYKNLYGGNE